MSTEKAIELFLNSRKAKGLSATTIKWYAEILYSFNKVFKKLPKRPEDIDIFLTSCPGKDERKHGYFRALRCFFNFLNIRYKTPNPITKIEQPKRSHKEPKTLNPYELQRLLNSTQVLDVKAALLFLTDTGARLGEMVNMSFADIETTEWGVVVHINGKTGMRTVPITIITYHILKKALPFKYNMHTWSIKVKKAFKKVGIVGSAHTLRHTFGTLWNGDELVLQRIMGHAHLSTTKLYRHIGIKNLALQHSQYTPLNNVSVYQLSMI